MIAPLSPRLKEVVAIVDDDRRLLVSLTELLEAAGFEVLGYSSGRDLLRGDALLRIDCVITDIGMPDLDGFALRGLVEERRPDIPIFLMTGRYELIERLETSDRPDRMIFRKPFDGRRLLSAITNALGERNRKA